MTRDGNPGSKEGKQATMKSEGKLATIKGGVCAPKGFRASGLKCGIKNPDSPKLDLALIYSDHPSIGAAVFTQNQVKAAPVRLSANYIRSDQPRAIVVNSGNANACTGSVGMDHARKMAEATAKALKLRQRQVLVCSTGIIGVPMPIDRILPRIPDAAAALKADATDAAEHALRRKGEPSSALLAHVRTNISDARLVFYPLYVVRYRYGGEAVEGGPSIFFAAVSGTTGKVVASHHPSALKSVVGRLGRLFGGG